MLHSIRSLFCTATNETPHERFFGFSRRSSSGASIPTWLATPGSAYVNRQVRASKMEPLVDEVELLQANPHYVHVRYPDGRETTVATKYLAPKGQSEVAQPPPQSEPVRSGQSEVAQPPPQSEPVPGATHVQNTDSDVTNTESRVRLTPVPVEYKADMEHVPVRRSERVRRPVVRLDL